MQAKLSSHLSIRIGMPDFMRGLLLFFILSMSVGGAKAADISPFTSSEEESYILFQGEIAGGDLIKLSEVHKKMPHPTRTTLLLHSPGGDVAEAMKIGDYLEKNSISVTVWLGEPFGKMNCLSSCVLILAGGFTKNPYGRIGIHRPYIGDTSTNPKDAKEKLRLIKIRMADYLENKGVSPQLAEDMFSTPPENIKILSSDEISKYRLNQSNYNKDEELDLETAKAMGWSRSELIKRQARWMKECAPLEIKALRKCLEEIVLEPVKK
jgi:hypothetical protein